MDGAARYSRRSTLGRAGSSAILSRPGSARSQLEVSAFGASERAQSSQRRTGGSRGQGRPALGRTRPSSPIVVPGRHRGSRRGRGRYRSTGAGSSISSHDVWGRGGFDLSLTATGAAPPGASSIAPDRRRARQDHASPTDDYPGFREDFNLARQSLSARGRRHRPREGIESCPTSQLASTPAARTARALASSPSPSQAAPPRSGRRQAALEVPASPAADPSSPYSTNLFVAQGAWRQGAEEDGSCQASSEQSRIARDHRPGEAALRGPASSLLGTPTPSLSLLGYYVEDASGEHPPGGARGGAGAVAGAGSSAGGANETGTRRSRTSEDDRPGTSLTDILGQEERILPIDREASSSPTPAFAPPAERVPRSPMTFGDSTRSSRPWSIPSEAAIGAEPLEGGQPFTERSHTHRARALAGQSVESKTATPRTRPGGQDQGGPGEGAQHGRSTPGSGARVRRTRSRAGAASGQQSADAQAGVSLEEFNALEEQQAALDRRATRLASARSLLSQALQLYDRAAGIYKQRQEREKYARLGLLGVARSSKLGGDPISDSSVSDGRERIRSPAKLQTSSTIQLGPRDSEQPSAAAAAKLRKFAASSVSTKLPAKGVRAKALRAASLPPSPVSYAPTTHSAPQTETVGGKKALASRVADAGFGAAASSSKRTTTYVTEYDLRDQAHALLDKATTEGEAAAAGDDSEHDSNSGMGSPEDEPEPEDSPQIVNPFEEYRKQYESIAAGSSLGAVMASSASANTGSGTSGMRGAAQSGSSVSDASAARRRGQPLVTMPTFFLTGWGLGGKESGDSAFQGGPTESTEEGDDDGNPSARRPVEDVLGEQSVARQQLGRIDAALQALREAGSESVGAARSRSKASIKSSFGAGSNGGAGATLRSLSKSEMRRAIRLAIAQGQAETDPSKGTAMKEPALLEDEASSSDDEDKSPTSSRLEDGQGPSGAHVGLRGVRYHSAELPSMSRAAMLQREANTLLYYYYSPEELLAGGISDRTTETLASETSGASAEVAGDQPLSGDAQAVCDSLDAMQAEIYRVLARGGSGTKTKGVLKELGGGAAGGGRGDSSALLPMDRGKEYDDALSIARRTLASIGRDADDEDAAARVLKRDSDIRGGGKTAGGGLLPVAPVDDETFAADRTGVLTEQQAKGEVGSASDTSPYTLAESLRELQALMDAALSDS